MLLDLSPRPINETWCIRKMHSHGLPMCLLVPWHDATETCNDMAIANLHSLAWESTLYPLSSL